MSSYPIASGEYGVGRVAIVAPRTAGGSESRDGTDFGQIVNEQALVDGPAARTVRPGVEITAPGGDLQELIALLLAQIDEGIGLAGGAVAVKFDQDVGHLMRVGDEADMQLGHPVDEVVAGAGIKALAEIGDGIAMENLIAEFDVAAIHRAGIAIDLLGDFLTVGGGAARFGGSHHGFSHLASPGPACTSRTRVGRPPTSSRFSPCHAETLAPTSCNVKLENRY